jgi:hypothetical protein
MGLDPRASIQLRSRPYPLVDCLGCVMPVGVLAESLSVMPVLVEEVAVPVHEPHDWCGPGRCDRNLRPERLVDALGVDIGVVPGVTSA